jgi:hypothetical protein
MFLLVQVVGRSRMGSSERQATFGHPFERSVRIKRRNSPRRGTGRPTGRGAWRRRGELSTPRTIREAGVEITWKLTCGGKWRVCSDSVSVPTPLLMLGLPKGSLEESTKNLFAKAGWKITTSSRSLPSVHRRPGAGWPLCAGAGGEPVCGAWVLRLRPDGLRLDPGEQFGRRRGVRPHLQPGVDAEVPLGAMCVPEASPVKSAARIWPANGWPPSWSTPRRRYFEDRALNPRGARVLLGSHRGEGPGSGRCHRRHHGDRSVAARGQAPDRRHAAGDEHQVDRQPEELDRSGEAEEDRDHRDAAHGARSRRSRRWA